MKVEVNQGIDTSGGDEFESYRFRFDEETNGHIFRSVTTYSDPIGSVVRELTSNCFDSHKRAGVDRDVEIAIINGNKLESTYDRIEFRDFGVGLSNQQVRDIFTVLGASDKREDNSEIGGFGLGSKSPFGYIRDLDGIDTFEIDTWYNGVHTKYSLMETMDGPRMTKLFSYEDDRTNGTTVSVPIGSDDIHKFKEEIKKQLAYFDNITYINCGVESTDYKVYKGENFVYRSDIQPYDQLHVCLGKVAYPLDFNQIMHSNQYSYNSNFDIKYSLGAPLALYFDIGEIDVTPTRESLLYNDKTIEAIDNKIVALQDELQEKFDKMSESISSMEEYLEACKTYKSSVPFDDVDVPISSGLIHNDKPKYPKYEDVQEYIPSDTDYIFQEWQNYKTVNSKGHISQSSSTQGINRILQYDKDKAFIVSTKYQTKKNKYMCSNYGEGLNTMFLVRRKQSLHKNHHQKEYNGIHVEDMTERQKQLLSFIINTYIKPNVTRTSNQLSFDNIEKILDFYDEVAEYLKDQFRDYDEIEVTEEYEEHLKKKRKKNRQNRKKKEDESFPVKYIDCSNGYQFEFKWSMGDIKYDRLNNTTTYIYGFADDDEKLLDLGPFWYHRRSHYEHSRSSKFHRGKKRLVILKIAMSREELFEDLDHAYHIDEWMKKKYYHPFFMKPTISRWLYDNYDRTSINVPSVIRETGIFNNHLDNILDKSYIADSGQKIKFNPIYEDIIDYYDWDSDPLNMPDPYGKSIRIAEGIQYILDEKLYLLNHITGVYSANKQKLKDHVKKYIKCQGFESNVNPELYYKLKRHKENNNSN